MLRVESVCSDDSSSDRGEYMNVNSFHSTINSLFGELLEQFKNEGEYAFYEFGPEQIHRVGFATNMTPEIVRQAMDQQVQLIITHHDAWNFIFGMREECHRLLKQHGVHHFFIHLPLDYAKFGTCNTLLEALGATIVYDSQHVDGMTIPGVGELPTPIPFEEMVGRISSVLNEEVFSWKNSDRLIRRIGMITGAGHATEQIREADSLGCDVYITGEKSLYSVQYAQYIGMNMIVGSHTFTEVLGVRSLVEHIKAQHPSLEVVWLKEEHVETSHTN